MHVHVGDEIVYEGPAFTDEGLLGAAVPTEQITAKVTGILLNDQGTTIYRLGDPDGSVIFFVTEHDLETGLVTERTGEERI